jgi:hypothetical protein
MCSLLPPETSQDGHIYDAPILRPSLAEMDDLRMYLARASPLAAQYGGALTPPKVGLRHLLPFATILDFLSVFRASLPRLYLIAGQGMRELESQLSFLTHGNPLLLQDTGQRRISSMPGCVKRFLQALLLVTVVLRRNY